MRNQTPGFRRRPGLVLITGILLLFAAVGAVRAFGTGRQSGRVEDPELKYCAVGIPATFCSGGAPAVDPDEIALFVDPTLWDRAVEVPVREWMGQLCYVKSKAEMDELLKRCFDRDFEAKVLNAR